MLKRTVLLRGATLLALVLTASTVLSAPALAQQTVPPTPTPVAVDTFDPAAAGGRTVVKWYVGLGTGGDPKQIDVQRRVVDQFNKSQDKTYLALQIVDNKVASTTLATQIAAGNVPDVVGPVGTVGRATFDGNYLDLTDLIQSNGVDLSQYDPAVVKAYNVPGQGQIGIPFAVFPSYIYFNKDLFDEAGLPYPPQNFASGWFRKLQAGHCDSKKAPHAVQKRRPPAFSAPHRGQNISDLQRPQSGHLSPLPRVGQGDGTVEGRFSTRKAR